MLTSKTIKFVLIFLKINILLP